MSAGAHRGPPDAEAADVAEAAGLGLRFGFFFLAFTLVFAAVVWIAVGDGLALAAGGGVAASPRHAVPYAADGRAPPRASAAMDALARADGCAGAGRPPGNSQTHRPSAAMPHARMMNRRRQ
jgi:hypothetical protein